MTSFADIWHRILFTTDLEKNSDSAVLVGTTPQYILRMKNKDEFSVAWAFEVAQKYGLNTDWIMTGKGSMKSSESEPEFHNELLHEIDKWLTGQIEKEPFLDEIGIASCREIV